MGNDTVEELIAAYGLEPHPEGGYYKETYRSRGGIPGSALPENFRGGRSYCTAIYFLLPQGERSRLHRIESDEIWHFYLGGPIVVVQIFPDGKVESTALGRDADAGQKLQHVVPAGCWFGAYPAPGSSFALVGCTVAPGFDFADFVLGEKAELLRKFPGARDVVEKLCDR